MIFPARPLIMGIVNVTPDSFSDGGKFHSPHAAITHGLQLLDDGADILDIGGESTRPPGNDYGDGAQVVLEQEELERVIPVIQGITSARPDAMISIDTMKPEVARQAIQAGAAMINDVSGGRYDEGIWKIAARFNVPYVLMHGYTPNNRAPVGKTTYYDVVEEVFEFLDLRIRAARRAGIQEVIADVGIGFAKKASDNIRLLQQHMRFTNLGVPLLVGASRKSFIGSMLGNRPPEERIIGTLAAHAVAASNGATILRVHDVRESREFFSVFTTLRSPLLQYSEAV